MRLFGISLLSVGLLACPSPPEQQGAGGAAPAGPQGQQQDAVAGGGGQAAADAAPTTDAGTGPGPANGMAEPLELDDQMKQTQDQVKTGEHFTVSGEIKGDCPGALRVSVIGTDAAPDQEGDPNKVTNAKDSVDPDGMGVQLLTAMDVTSIGGFSVAVPKGDYQMIELAALCDLNGDGKITGGVDAISGPSDATGLNKDTTGVVLKLDKLPVPVAPEEGEPPVEASGEPDNRGYVPKEGEDPNAVGADGPPPQDEPAGGPTAGAGQQPPGAPPQGLPPAGLPEDGPPPPEGE